MTHEAYDATEDGNNTYDETVDTPQAAQAIKLCAKADRDLEECGAHSYGPYCKDNVNHFKQYSDYCRSNVTHRGKSRLMGIDLEYLQFRDGSIMRIGTHKRYRQVVEDDDYDLIHAIESMRVSPHTRG